MVSVFGVMMSVCLVLLDWIRWLRIRYDLIVLLRFILLVSS